MKPGIYTNAELSNEAYHASEGVSSTTLKELINRSPAHCRAYMDGLRKKGSASMSLGTIIHSAVLEPESFGQEYFVLPARADYPEALETLEDYRAAAEAHGVDLSSKSSKPAIRAELEKAADGLVFWEDLVAAAPTKEKYPNALDSAADFKESCGLHGVEVPAKATKAAMRAALVGANAEVEFWDDLAAQIPKKADHPEALDSPADYKAKAEELGVDLSAKTTKGEIRAALEAAGVEATYWDDLVAVPEGMVAITREQANVAAGVCQSIFADPEASHWLSGGVAEQSYYWRDRLTGELCKARSDYYLESEGIIADLKTCEDARPEAVARSIAKYGYDISAAMYLDGVAANGLPANGFVWVFAETAPPYAVRCYLATDALLARARGKFHSGLEQFSFCRSADNWPGYAVGLVEIDLPGWARKNDEELAEVA